MRASSCSQILKEEIQEKWDLRAYTGESKTYFPHSGQKLERPHQNWLYHLKIYLNKNGDAKYWHLKPIRAAGIVIFP